MSADEKSHLMYPRGTCLFDDAIIEVEIFGIAESLSSSAHILGCHCCPYTNVCTNGRRFDIITLTQDLLKLSHDEMADIFARWNQGQLDSFLIDITKDILRFKESATGDALVTKIRDAAGQKVGSELRGRENSIVTLIMLLTYVCHRSVTGNRKMDSDRRL